MEFPLPPFRKLVSAFSEVSDPRVERTKMYPLVEILFLCTSAVISGFEGWEEIVDFGEAKLGWLRKYLPYEHGIPSHDTVNRVVSMLDYRVFEQCFIDWATMDVQLPSGTVISLDGKKICGSASKKEQQTAHANGGKSAKHIVHAWCSDLQLCLGQYQVASKSNEIVAIPALLELLDVQGCVLTMDAMGCQKKITELAVAKQADYLIGLKANQGQLLKGVSEAFEQRNGNLLGVLPNEFAQGDRNHGRIEARLCQVLPADDLPAWAEKEAWIGLKSIVRIESIRENTASGLIESDERFYISSLTYTADEFNQLIRQHWCVENQLHWTLDVLFGEDASRKRAANAAENFSTIRKIAINLLKANQDKISVNRKRTKCALYDDFRTKILQI